MRTGPGAETANAVRHARVRALERYGLALTAVEMRGLEAQLAAGAGMILRRQADGSTIQVVRFEGELVTCVLGPGGFIHTFLPKEAPFKRSWRTPR